MWNGRRHVGNLICIWCNNTNTFTSSLKINWLNEMGLRTLHHCFVLCSSNYIKLSLESNDPQFYGSRFKNWRCFKSDVCMLKRIETVPHIASFLICKTVKIFLSQIFIDSDVIDHRLSVYEKLSKNKGLNPSSCVIKHPVSFKHLCKAISKYLTRKCRVFL